MLSVIGMPFRIWNIESISIRILQVRRSKEGWQEAFDVSLATWLDLGNSFGWREGVSRTKTLKLLRVLSFWQGRSSFGSETQDAESSPLELTVFVSWRPTLHYPARWLETLQGCLTMAAPLKDTVKMLGSNFSNCWWWQPESAKTRWSWMKGRSPELCWKRTIDIDWHCKAPKRNAVWVLDETTKSRTATFGSLRVAGAIHPSAPWAAATQRGSNH